MYPKTTRATAPKAGWYILEFLPPFVTPEGVTDETKSQNMALF